MVYSDRYSKIHYENVHSNALNILPSKNEKFQMFSDIRHISAQNIHCGYTLEPTRQSGSNAYPQYVFFFLFFFFCAEIRNIMYTHNVYTI